MTASTTSLDSFTSRASSCLDSLRYLLTASTTSLDSFTSRVSSCLDRLPVDSLHHLPGQLHVQGQQLLGQLTCRQPPPPLWTASRPGSAAVWTDYLLTASTTSLDSFTSRASICLDGLPVDSLHHLLGQLHVQRQQLHQLGRQLSLSHIGNSKNIFTLNESA